jgi:TPR repeat protein
MKRLAAAVLLLLANQALAQTADEAAAARAAMQAGDYAEAYYLWRGLAEAGDPDALYNLGWMHHNGYGLTIDDAKAQSWWEQAAAHDSVDALSALGNLHRFGGRGVPVDGPRAVDYFLRAATRGDDESALLLRTLIGRNDPAVSERRVELLTQHAAALGAPIVVRSDRTGFRKSAAAESKVLAVFPQGKALIELSRKSGWVQAGDPGDGRVGWLRGTLVKPAE